MPSNPAKNRGYVAHGAKIKRVNYFEIIVSLEKVKVRNTTTEEQDMINDKIYSIIMGWTTYRRSNKGVAATKTDLAYGFKLLKTASDRVVRANFSIESCYFQKLLNLLREMKSGATVFSEEKRPSKSIKWDNAIQGYTFANEVWYQLRHNSNVNWEDVLTVGQLLNALYIAKRGNVFSLKAKETIRGLSILSPVLEKSGYREHRLERLIVPLSTIWTDLTQKSLLPDNRIGEWCFYAWLEGLFEGSDIKAFLSLKTEIEQIIRDEMKFLEK